MYSVNMNVLLETIGTEDKKVYKGRIANIEENSIYIEIPFNEETGRFESPQEGMNLRVWFYGADQSRAHFDARVTGKAEENISMITIERPKMVDIHKTQRRNFVRVPTVVEAAVEIHTNKGKVSFLCKTEDVSGGGFSAKFNPEIVFRMADKGTAWLVLPRKNQQIFHAFAEIEAIRIRYPEEPKHLAWASFKFNNLSEVERSKIIQYTYQRQIDLYGK